MKKISLLFFIFIFSGCFIILFLSNLILNEYPEEYSSDPLISIFSTNLDNVPKNPVYLKIIADIKNDFISENKSFLEINISAKKARLYKETGLIKEVPILKAGDPNGWGGSAVGLYKIISKNKVSFSVISDVYMPHALHYYGKYYIHGEPYYPDGSKLISPISGGCITLNDKDAKALYGLIELNMPVLIIDKENDYYQHFDEKLSDLSAISAKSYLVADLDSSFVFTEKNSKEQLPITSLTKLMTAVVVAENIDLRKPILVKPEMLGANGITQGLEAGKEFRVIDLFYPLLIESSDDAAEVLSYFLGRKKTIEMMNKKSEAILMTNTEFIESGGFSHKNVSTAQDLFQLLRYVYNNRPPLLEIAKGKKVRTFGKVRFEIKNLRNKNIFTDEPNFVGGITGYLPTSKNNGFFIFKFITKDEKIRTIAIVLLDCDDNKIDVQKIYKWLQENYSLTSAPKN